MSTLQDIAKVAGASKSAVSLVLNGKPGIGKDVRARILEAAQSLGYQSKRLAARATNQAVIRFLWIVKHGRILNSDHRGFIADYLQGMHKASADSGFRLEVMSFDGFDAERLVEVMGSGIAGVVILATELNGDEIALLGKVPVAKVFIDSNEEDLSYDFVDMDNTAAVHRIVDYLVSLGHRRIGLVQSQMETRNFALRQLAFLAALARSGLMLNADDLFLVDPTYDGATQNLIGAFSLAESLPTALFCVNDVIAYGTLRALGFRLVPVPDQISIVGFDDLPTNAYVTPPLTSMTVSKHAIGNRAIQLLKARIEDPTKPCEKVLIGGELVLRYSVRDLSDLRE